MNEFIPENKETLTYRECLAPAMDIAKINLGYYAGYYCRATRERVERLFRCAHPVFGKVESETPEQLAAELKSEAESIVDGRDGK